MSPDDYAISHHSNAHALVHADEALAQHLPFSGLSDKQRTDILDQATVKRISLNDTCFSEGDEARNFYVLLDGALKIYRSTDDGEQVVIIHISPGQMFGIARAYADDTYQMTANAVCDGLALSWSSENWDRFMRDYPEFERAARKAIGERRDEMSDKIVDMATLQVEQRIAKAILRLTKRYGKTVEGGIEIGFPITRQDISEMTGTTLHSVSRYMSKWQKAGIVRSSRRRVIVERPEALPI